MSRLPPRRPRSQYLQPWLPRLHRASDAMSSRDARPRCGRRELVHDHGGIEVFSTDFARFTVLWSAVLVRTSQLFVHSAPFVGFMRHFTLSCLDTKWSVQNEECSKTPRVGALGRRVPDDVEGYAVEPESRGGRDGSRCTSRRYRVPMPAPAPVPQIVVAAAPVDRAASRLYIRRADVQKYGYSMNCLGCRSVMTNTTARAHTEECRRRSENCLAEDEETKFRSEAAKLRVEGWLASRVESTDKSSGGGAVSREPSGAASSSAPAAAASSSAPAVASSSSKAAERFRSDEVLVSRG